MERIASFSVDHLLLEPGVYVSRIDRDPATGAAVTTFDLRLTTPNKEPVMNTAECHTIEHLGATFLRNHAEWSSRIVYFGPMGCQTGFFFLFDERKLTLEGAVALMKKAFAEAAAFEGEMPGKSPIQCGNYINLDVETGRAVCRWYSELIRDWTVERLSYDWQGK